MVVQILDSQRTYIKFSIFYIKLLINYEANLPPGNNTKIIAQNKNIAELAFHLSFSFLI